MLLMLEEPEADDFDVKDELPYPDARRERSRFADPSAGGTVRAPRGEKKESLGGGGLSARRRYRGAGESFFSRFYNFPLPVPARALTGSRDQSVPVEGQDLPAAPPPPHHLPQRHADLGVRGLQPQTLPWSSCPSWPCRTSSRPGSSAPACRSRAGRPPPWSNPRWC